MSDQPTRAHPDWWCAWRQHWRATPCLCEQLGSLNTGCGLVVPVEPDYEAAWGAFVENENHEPTECACQCEHTTERAVQAAVDAAYGGRR